MFEGLKARAMNAVAKVNGKRSLQLAQLFLMMAWPLLLSKTDSYFVIYVLCSMFAVLAFAFNRRSAETESKVVYGVTAGLSCLFSGLVLLANYPLFSPIRENAWEILTVLLGGFVVAQNVWLFLYRRLPEWEAKKEAHHFTDPRSRFWCRLSFFRRSAYCSCSFPRIPACSQTTA